MSLSLGLGLALTRNKGGADALHGVQVQAARSPGRTFFRNGLRRSTSLTDVATVTRATTAWGVDQGGNVAAVAAGQPVVNTAGLAVYEARTNSIRNPTGLGAAAGTPGTLPTNWGRSVAPFSTEVVGASTRNGVPGVLVRIFGTNGGAISYPAIYTDVATQIAASPGQTWTAQVFTEVVAGSVAGLQPNIQLQELNGSGAYLTQGNLPASQSFAENRVSRVLSDPSVAYVRLAYVLIVPASASIDCTVFIGGPNLKLGADIKDPPILQTNNAAATRNADVITEAVNIPPGQSFTITGKLTAPVTNSGQFPTVFELRDAANRNNLTVHFDGGTNNLYCVATSGGSLADYSGGAFDATRAPGTLVGFAITVEGGSIKWSVNGGADKTLPALANGSFHAALTQLAMACRVVGTQQLNSPLRDLRIEMRAYTPAERAAASDVTLTHDVDFTSRVYQYVGAPYVTPTDLPGTTFSRATSGTDRDSGQIVNFAAGVLKITSAGCLFEAQKTNVVRFSEGTTALLGVWGSGGAAPGDGSGAWSQASTTAGMTISTSAKGTYPDGCDWWEFTLSGTPNATQTTGFYFDANPVAGAASSGQTWVSALDMEFISMTGCTGGSIAVFGRKADGSGNEAGGSVALPTTPTARARYASLPLTLADALTARIAGGVSFSYTSGVPVNIVIRITAAQVERDYVSSYKKTTGSAVTGNADLLASVNDNNPSAYTVFAEFTVPLTGPAYSQVWHYDDGTDQNRTTLYYDRAIGRIYGLVTTGNVTQALLNLGAVTPGQSYKAAVAVAANDFAGVMTGGSVQTDASGTVPTTSNFRYAHAVYQFNFLGAPLKRIRRFSTRKTNTELQALVA